MFDLLQFTKGVTFIMFNPLNPKTCWWFKKGTFSLNKTDKMTHFIRARKCSVQFLKYFTVLYCFIGNCYQKRLIQLLPTNT